MPERLAPAGVSMTDVAYDRAVAEPAGGQPYVSPTPIAYRALPRAVRLLEGRGWRLALAVSDFLALTASAALANLHAGVAGDTATLLFLPLALIALYRSGLYEDRRGAGLLDSTRQLAEATGLAAALTLAALALVDPGTGASGVAVAWLVGFGGIWSNRLVLEAGRRHARVRGIGGLPALIVGSGEIGGRLERILGERPQIGLDLRGSVDVDELTSSPESLERVLRRTGARHLVIAFSLSPDSALMPVVRRCGELGIGVSVVPRLFEGVGWRVSIEHVGPMPVLEMRQAHPKGWQFRAKHTMDRVLAAMALLVAGPLMVALALAVRLSSPGPILFRQWRVGRDGRPFQMLKFRTMREPSPEEEAVVELAPDSAPGGVEGVDRRTRIGIWLRKTSLDELPQLLNALKGEMSMVGPRPERPEFVEALKDEVHSYDARHRVKAGITGLAQVYGLRGQTSVTRRIEWDNHYIENWSLWLDLKILLMTVVAVLRGSE